MHKNQSLKSNDANNSGSPATSLSRMVTDTGGRGSRGLRVNSSRNCSGGSLGISSSIISTVVHASCSVGEKDIVELTATKSAPAAVGHKHKYRLCIAK